MSDFFMYNFFQVFEQRLLKYYNFCTFGSHNKLESVWIWVQSTGYTYVGWGYNQGFGAGAGVFSWSRSRHFAPAPP